MSVYIASGPLRAWVCHCCVAAFSLGVLACRGSSANTQVSGAPSAAAQVKSRAESVEQADRMASEASRASGQRAVELWSRAAQLREQLYRTEHKPLDALESIEALKALERLEARPCATQLKRTLLEAELKREPAQAYKEIHAFREKQSDPECRKSAERALHVLTAYRPLPSVLAELSRSDAGVAPADSSAKGTPASSAEPIVMPPAVASDGPARVTGIERYGAKDAARVVVFVTRPTRFEVGEVEARSEHPRVFVDIENATVSANASYDVGGLVQRVRTGVQPRGARVVLDLNGPVSRRVFYLPEPFRLVIDVQKEAEGTTTGEKRALRRVVLDPGHGGHDPGATGPAGLHEKDVVLDIAHRAAPLIARELGISTLLTRDGDQYVALDERTARANAFRADLFVSIHCNASEDGSAKGVMTFVLDAGREELAQRVAARENAASSEAAVELANAFSRLSDPASRAASARFAELLQRAAMASLAQRYPEVPNGGVKRAGFYVLAGARMPAVLFETSFISNAGGEASLNTGDFRQKMADGIVNAIRAYRDGL
ncbi:MAG TPA: N-acetylmuramoyl-L-alanine amidase [Polyangiaceae bacterium]|nr:N-acetylmuramoyl-L-alanine amidase [Polyangiaceae bacterium]